jgi:hypothetical protein
MKKLVTINDVRISTATVDIQVMRIGSKQMTLAVFRQLPSKNILNERGNLLAHPWGWVNYDRGWELTPFVFSYEGVLYRSDVFQLQGHHNLVVKPIVKERYDYVSSRTIKTTTGKWHLRLPNDSSLIIGDFESEAGARAHLENRLKSVAILEAAPQLFIAV